MTLTNEQQIAADAIRQFLESDEREFVLIGYAGTGKTYTIGKALSHRGNIQYVAPTHKAAGVLRDSTGQETTTIHTLLACRKSRDLQTGQSGFFPNFEKEKASSASIVVVDEASMIGTEMRRWLLEAVTFSSTKIIWMGDPCQLPPVEDESVVFTSGLPHARLETIMRNAGDVQRAATNVRLKIGDADTQWAEPGENLFRVGQDEFLAAYLERRATAKLIAWRNDVVEWLNDWVRDQLYHDKKPYHVDERLVVVSTWANHGETVMLHAEDELVVAGFNPTKFGELTGYFLDVHHAKYGLITLPVIAKESQLKYARQLLDLKKRASASRKSADWREFFDLQEQFVSVRPGWSTTVHKSQGSTYDQAFVVETDIRGCSDHLTRNMLTYVAYSRAKEELWIS